MFVSPAFAQDAAAGAAGGLEAFLPLILIFVVFYFMLIRPQQKRAKAHKELLAQLRRGDRVITSGGLMGTITKVVDDREVVLEIADGVKVRMLRSTVAEVISKTEPAETKEVEADKAEDK